MHQFESLHIIVVTFQWHRSKQNYEKPISFEEKWQLSDHLIIKVHPHSNSKVWYKDMNRKTQRDQQHHQDVSEQAVISYFYFKFHWLWNLLTAFRLHSYQTTWDLVQTEKSAGVVFLFNLKPVWYFVDSIDKAALIFFLQCRSYKGIVG